MNLFQKIISLAIVLKLFFSNAFAGDLFKITNRAGSCSSTPICDVFEQVLNTYLPDASSINFLPGMADAAILANKGLVTDYASYVEYLSIGAGLGIAIDPGAGTVDGLGDGNATLPAIGIGGTIGLGANLGVYMAGDFWKRSIAYINYFKYSLTTGEVSGEVSSIGFHYQYKLILPQRSVGSLIRWGGVDVIAGIEQTSTKIQTVVPLNESYFDGTNTASYNGVATVGADISTISFPIEITTDVEFFYLLSFYFGLGFDINSGSSKSIANTTGNINVTGGLAGSGDATLDLGVEKSPSSTSFRTITGIQLNLTAFRVFVQKMSRLGEDDEQISAGVRVSW